MIAFVMAVLFLVQRCLSLTIRKCNQEYQPYSTLSLFAERSTFLGQETHLRIIPPSKRSFSVKQSSITMMPEGPEVRTVVDQLQGGVGRRLIDIQFLSGRYVRHGKPEGFHAFAKTMTPIFQPQGASNRVDVIQEWNTKGKFIYITLDQGNNLPQAYLTERADDNHNFVEVYDGNIKKEDDDAFKRSIWITLGMTGQFVNEQIHQQDPKYARWYIELLDLHSNKSNKIYYHDRRNFGTLRFSLSSKELDAKLESLGPDILDDANFSEQVFLDIVSKQRSDLNVCKFLMDQSVRINVQKKKWIVEFHRLAQRIEADATHFCLLWVILENSGSWELYLV